MQAMRAEHFSGGVCDVVAQRQALCILPAGAGTGGALARRAVGKRRTKRALAGAAGRTSLLGSSPDRLRALAGAAVRSGIRSGRRHEVDETALHVGGDEAHTQLLTDL